jgi:hypothetical protein
MSGRRASLPGAAELFRATAPAVGTAPEPPPLVAVPDPGGPPATNAVHPVHEAAAIHEPADSTAAPGVRTVTTRPGRKRRSGERRPSGRELHEEKITVYLAPEELIDLEHARLALRAEHGLAVDRGRIVREAVAVVVADLEAKGDESILVRRLRGF